MYTLRGPVARRVTELDVPFATHRLDLVFVPEDPEEHRPLDGLLALGEAHGWWCGSDPGPTASALGVDGFASLRAETFPAPRLIANGLGGFRVGCGACGAAAARALGRAMAIGRGAGVPLVSCGACGVSQRASSLAYAPPAAFACVALTLVDVGSPAVSDAAAAAIASGWGAWRSIARRVG